MKEKHLYKDELKKLLIVYSLSFIVACIIAVFTFIQIYSNRVVRINNQEANTIAHKAITSELDAYEQIILSIEQEEEFKSFVTKKTEDYEVYRLIYDFINKRAIKSIFYYVDTSGKTILTNNYAESPYNSSDIFLSGLFKQLSQQTDDILYLNNKVQIDLTKRTVYSIGKTIKVNDNIVGYLIFELLESDLNKIIYKANAEVLVLTDQYNNVITTTNSLVLDEIGKFNLARNKSDTLMFNNKEYYYLQSNLNDNRLSLYTLSELEVVRELMTRSLAFMVILLFIFTLVAITIADVAAKKKTESIRSLITAIGEVQKGNLKAFVDNPRTDEFKLISDQFNQMLVDLDSLLLRNHELVDRTRVSEIKQLESQFNPHFIFNTLETLKYMVHIDKEKASDIIVNFAKILRYSIDYSGQNIPLDQDIDYLNSYLLIHKYRYNKRLTYNFDIQKEAKDCIVPKLIMQPLIENCINHGYKKKETLHIEVKTSIIEEELITIISDNGDGMTHEQLQKIIASIDGETINNGHIGLNNVHRRIKLLYGPTYGLHIESIPDIGTTITINMPVKKW